MPELIHTLIIEDHPLVAENYKNALLLLSSDSITYQFKIEMVRNGDSALQKIEKAKKTTAYNLVFLDIGLPPSKDRTIMSGEDLGIVIKKNFPKTKIIVITGYSHNYRLHNIFRSLSPHAILVKSDIGFSDLKDAIRSVLSGIPFFSKTVAKLIRSYMSYDIVLDRKDRVILYELSKGTRMKELSEIVSLSIPGLQRRKQRLKEAFDVVNQNDRILIEKGRTSGFV